MNCEVSPIVYNVCVFKPGRIVMAESALGLTGEPGLTVRAAAPMTVEPDCEVAVAVMVVRQLDVPQATAVAKPEESIVATPGTLDTQVTCPARFSVVGGAL